MRLYDMSDLSIFRGVEKYIFLIFFNSIIYTLILTFFFSVFFLFDFRKFRTLNEYKFFRSYGFINTSLIILFLSFAGVPPLLGFTSKFFIFLAIFESKQLVLFYLMVVFNLFVMYFYLQNIRFLFGKFFENIFFFKASRVYLNWSLISILVVGLFLNTTVIFYLDFFFI